MIKHSHALILFGSIIAAATISVATGFTFTEPGDTPTGGNADPPINVSGSSQNKTGSLGIGQPSLPASSNAFEVNGFYITNDDSGGAVGTGERDLWVGGKINGLNGANIEGGLQLNGGTSIDEISTDLVGNGHNSVPTNQAVIDYLEEMNFGFDTFTREISMGETGYPGTSLGLTADEGTCSLSSSHSHDGGGADSGDEPKHAKVYLDGNDWRLFSDDQSSSHEEDYVVSCITYNRGDDGGMESYVAGSGIDISDNTISFVGDANGGVVEGNNRLIWDSGKLKIGSDILDGSSTGQSKEGALTVNNSLTAESLFVNSSATIDGSLTLNSDSTIDGTFTGTDFCLEDGTCLSDMDTPDSPDSPGVTDCYDSSNIGKVGDDPDTPCYEMLIVDNQMLRDNASEEVGGNESWTIGRFTFTDDYRNIFTGQVTDMSRLFWSAENFNQDIGYWDVSSVKDMSSMFFNATSFNQDISTKTINAGQSNEYTAWDVSSVKDMSSMFSTKPFSIPSFNQDIGNWDVSSVTDMRSMFFYALHFNQDISTWCVESVTYYNNFDKYTTTRWWPNSAKPSGWGNPC